MRKLFVIIVGFNGGDVFVDLLTCLQQEIWKIKSPKIEIVIVDNDSADKAIEKIRMRNNKLGIEIIRNKKNLGFASGCNIGIKYAINKKTDAVLLINQDVVIEKDFIKPLLTNSADIIAPVIKFQRGNRWIYDFGGRINWWWGRTEHIEESSKFKAQSSKLDKKIDYVSGCCMLIKKEVFEKIGLFDERFFLYFEDADFCTRAKNAGFTIAVEPKSIIIHEFAEGKDRSPIKRRNLILSNLLFINKYLGWKVIFGYAYIFLLWMKMMTEKSDEKI